MKEFLYKNWKVILFGFLGLLLGAFLNYIVNEISNKDLLNSLLAQQKDLLAQSKNAKLTTDQQMKLVILQAQINLLKNK